MGMFDNISTTEALPYSDEMKELGLDKNNLTFQTKDLECLLDSYIIQNGKLYIQKYKVEKWIDGEKDSKNLFDRIGRLEKEEPYYQEVNYHGEIYFYEYIMDVQDKWDCWIEYKAIFTEGALSKIELSKFEKKDNTERKRLNLELNQKIEKEAAVWYNKYIFYTKFYRCYISRPLYKFLNKIGNFFLNLSYKI